MFRNTTDCAGIGEKNKHFPKGSKIKLLLKVGKKYEVSSGQVIATATDCFKYSIDGEKNPPFWPFRCGHNCRGIHADNIMRTSEYQRRRKNGTLPANWKKAELKSSCKNRPRA